MKTAGDSNEASATIGSSSTSLPTSIKFNLSSSNRRSDCWRPRRGISALLRGSRRSLLPSEKNKNAVKFNSKRTFVSTELPSLLVWSSITVERTFRLANQSLDVTHDDDASFAFVDRSGHRSTQYRDWSSARCLERWETVRPALLGPSDHRQVLHFDCMRVTELTALNSYVASVGGFFSTHLTIALGLVAMRINSKEKTKLWRVNSETADYGSANSQDLQDAAARTWQLAREPRKRFPHPQQTTSLPQ